MFSESILNSCDMRKSMYTIGIVDDQIESTTFLKYALQEFPFLHITYEQDNPLKALEYLRTEKLDMLFLDMDMPQMDGETLVSMLKDPPVIAICTNYDNYGYVVSRIQAKGYISKMPKFELLEQLIWDMIAEVDRREENNNKPKVLMIMDIHNKEQALHVNEVLFISCDDKLLTIVTLRKTYTIRMSLSALMGLLPTDEFCQVHRSYVVSLGAIIARNSTELIINSNDTIIPLGRIYKDSFQKAIATYDMQKRR